MSRVTTIRPEFVDRIPKALPDGVIYISEKYSTAAHNCCCGCGVKIMTPLKPGRWRLVKSAGLVSLHPSIGNWSAACQSHYWISRNRIEWERIYTPSEIAANRVRDKRVLREANELRYASEKGFWRRLRDKIRSWF
jgi:hypothetical protein